MKKRSYSVCSSQFRGTFGNGKIPKIIKNLSPIYTAENFWCGSDETGTRTQKIELITHLHVLFSTVLNDVKL